MTQNLKCFVLREIIWYPAYLHFLAISKALITMFESRYLNLG